MCHGGFDSKSTTAAHATAGGHSRRAHQNTMIVANTAAISAGKRKAHSDVPKSFNESPASHTSSGGL